MVEAAYNGLIGWVDKMIDTEWKPHILIVDENEDDRVLLARHLRRSNFIVSEIDAVDEVLPLIEEKRPEIIVVSEKMTLLDGFKFSALLRENVVDYHLFQILLLEGYTQANIRKAKNIGIDAVVAKSDYANKPSYYVEIEELVKRYSIEMN